MVVRKQMYQSTSDLSMFSLRRVIWNLIRMENEHLNNVGEFRAVRTLFC